MTICTPVHRGNGAADTWTTNPRTRSAPRPGDGDNTWG